MAVSLLMVSTMSFCKFPLRIHQCNRSTQRWQVTFFDATQTEEIGDPVIVDPLEVILSIIGITQADIVTQDVSLVCVNFITHQIKGAIGTSAHVGWNKKPLSGDRQTQEESVAQKTRCVHWQMPINIINNKQQPATNYVDHFLK